MKTKFRRIALVLFSVPIFFVVCELFLVGGLFLWQKIRMNIVSNNELVIYVVGGSTSVGYPFSQLSFSSIVRDSLVSSNINKGKITVINLARPGNMISETYWNLFWELAFHAEKKAMLLVYSGINDLINNEDDSSEIMWNMLAKSTILFKVLDNIVINSKYEFIGPIFKNTLYKYKYHLRKIIELGHDLNYPVFVSTLVGNYFDFSPVYNGLDTKEAMDALLLEKRFLFNDAWKKYTALVKKDIENRDYYYFRLGKIAQIKGNDYESRAFFWDAIKYAKIPYSPARWKNQEIRHSVFKNRAFLVDSDRNLREIAPQGYVGYNYFFDVHHPNILGVKIVADSFIDVISNYYGIKPRYFSVEEIKKRYEIDSIREKDHIITSIFWHFGYANNSKIKESYLRRIRNLLKKLPQEEKMIQYIRALVFFYEGDMDSFAKEIKGCEGWKDIMAWPEIVRRYLFFNDDPGFDQIKYSSQLKELWLSIKKHQGL